MRVWHAFSKLIIGPIWKKPLSKICVFISDSQAMQDVEPHLLNQIPFAPPVLVTFPFSDQFGPEFRRSNSYDEKRIWVLRDVIASIESGLVWTKNGLIFAESVGSMRRCISGPIEDMLMPVSRFAIQGPAVLCPDTGYYHWIHEILPNLLHILKHMEASTILVPSTANAYVFETLKALLGKSRFEASVAVNSGAFTVNNLLMIPITYRSGFSHPTDLEILRKFSEKISHNQDCIRQRCLYISRREAPKRHIANEDAIEAVLKDNGFETVLAEHLTFLEQVMLFSEAEVIVAPHGAGLANMIWRRGRCRIVELMPPAFNDVYARLSVQLGFEYKVIRGEGQNGNLWFDPIKVLHVAVR